MRGHSIAAIIPAYNEEFTIGTILVIAGLTLNSLVALMKSSRVEL